jgi:hypothetical protein
MKPNQITMLALAGILFCEPFHATCQLEHVHAGEYSKPPIACEYVQTGSHYSGLNASNEFTSFISGCL